MMNKHLTNYKVSWWEHNPKTILSFDLREQVCVGKRALDILLKQLNDKRGNARQVKVEIFK